MMHGRKTSRSRTVRSLATFVLCVLKWRWIFSHVSGVAGCHL